MAQHTCRLIVFDWDGTLIDSATRIVDTVNAALGDLDEPRVATARVRDAIGLGLREVIAQLLPDRDESLHNRFIECYRRRFAATQATPDALFPAVRETLGQLRNADYTLAIATGKSRAGLERELVATGLQGYFHSIRGADETRSKPHPQMLLELMEECGYDAVETLMVGDTVYDLAMAREAGVQAAAVTYGVHARERLRAFAPLALLDSLSELPIWLQAPSSFETVIHRSAGHGRR